ncbi:MAG TPA: dihydropteroate synthase [Spirochaetota bacterium]|nr:dihydropteroate synthase [Spirochaetota bacterium]HPI89271.1 dihydropteroate synthase [Spirochaetota bacterium]HPR48569.1 dihydropteroate synthase [Spirochaetota bacterium]
MKIMGIINVTPDSFYDGGRYYDRYRAVEHAVQLAEEGADILDIGGESTRPGAAQVSEQEEMDRVCPVIEEVARRTALPVSVDTTKAAVAEAALKCGASMINDISGCTFDAGMADVAARFGAGMVLMHIKGRPESMQNNPLYDGDFLSELYSFLSDSVERALRAGVSAERIIIDPGIGFGKTLEHNYLIINNIGYFKKMGYPVLIGLSRKSLIKNLYNNGSDCLPATIALNTVSYMNGADIIRVHDVREHRLALKSLDMLKKVS